jgi:hypothetical protein
LCNDDGHEDVAEISIFGVTFEPVTDGSEMNPTKFLINDLVTEFVNGVFQELKDSGKWAELHQQWIGKYTGETAEPPTITVDEAVEMVKNN